MGYLWPWRLIDTIVILAALYCIVKARKAVNRLHTPKSVQIARVWAFLANALTIASVVIIILELWVMPLSGWKFLTGLGILIVFLSEVGSLVKVDIILCKPILRTIAYSYAMQANRAIENGLDGEAIKKIRMACEFDPEEPRHWLTFSVLEKNDLKKAREYMQIAENLIAERGMKSRRISAWKEFIKGNLILAEHGNIQLALEHFNGSLKLHYDKERAKFVQKIEESGRSDQNPSGNRIGPSG